MSLAADLKRCRELEAASLAAWVRDWRLEDARRRPCWPSHRVRVFRGRERRDSAVRTAAGQGSDDPHIDGAPPVAVGRQEVAHA